MKFNIKIYYLHNISVCLYYLNKSHIMMNKGHIRKFYRYHITHLVNSMVNRRLSSFIITSTNLVIPK